MADTAAAQRCVELLRRRSLGVATFLLLDKQRHLARAAGEKAAPPEGVEPETASGTKIEYFQMGCEKSFQN